MAMEIIKPAPCHAYMCAIGGAASSLVQVPTEGSAKQYKGIFDCEFRGENENQIRKAQQNQKIKQRTWPNLRLGNHDYGGRNHRAFLAFLQTHLFKRRRDLHFFYLSPPSTVVGTAHGVPSGGDHG
ncbi:hypothetical protein CCACVL1_22584 [Corchorus capsularis]|uniref:Uncharacterized protein n=1 Tax=Corchorus capsularis TaxID=210143 RepID=A0A1R3GXW4_COCAP|nr:hypothetical protein CCACVL1_22584 [Corchorus capsularis]